MASLMPVEMHPLLRWRMAAMAANHRDRDTWVGKLNRSRPGFMQAALDEITERGPLSAREISGAGASRGGWWGWSDGKRAVEALFASGKVATAGRRGFERVYDLTERVIPARVLAMPTPAPEDAHRSLLRIAARALGVGTEKDLCDYFRIRIGAGRPRIRELVEAGELLPVTVEGLEGAGLRRTRCAVAAQNRRARPALSVRLAGLGSCAHRKSLRLPLPHRNLHAVPASQVRLLRSAIPAWRSHRRPRRSEIRSRSEHPPRPRRPLRTRHPPRRNR